MLGQAGYLYIYYVFATWLPGYLTLERNMSVLNTGIVGMLPFLIGTAAVVFGGWAADRLIEAGCARHGCAQGVRGRRTCSARPCSRSRALTRRTR